MSLSPPPTGARLEAAKLAFAMIRFAEGAAHPKRGTVPPDAPRVGHDIYIFTPSRAVRRERVPAFLVELPAPALMFPTTTRGIIGLHLLNELSGDRAAEMQRLLANQSAGVNELAEQLALTPRSRILLENGDETSIFTHEALMLWSEHFAVDIGWNLTEVRDNAVASARLNLFRSDGINSPHAPGPRRGT
mgnify:CR=1 FL=1